MNCIPDPLIWTLLCRLGVDTNQQSFWRPIRCNTDIAGNMHITPEEPSGRKFSFAVSVGQDVWEAGRGYTRLQSSGEECKEHLPPSFVKRLLLYFHDTIQPFFVQSPTRYSFYVPKGGIYQQPRFWGQSRLAWRRFCPNREECGAPHRQSRDPFHWQPPRNREFS